MPLTDTQIRNAKAREKAYRLSDERGLYLEISPTGGKWWRLKYRFEGREKRLSLGVYPAVELKLARERRDQARKLIADGIDPSLKRKADRAARAEANANTFEAVAREWLLHRKHVLQPSTFEGVKSRLERHLFPWLGKRPLAALEAPELLTALKRAEALGIGETPRRLKQYCSQIFRYGIATGRVSRDPAADLRGALKPHKPQHLAAVTDPKRVGALLRAIDGYRGEFVTLAALRLAPLVFVRPGELRRAEWHEFDLEAGEWRIPGHRMKMREAHLVPLARQAIEILCELRSVTGRWAYVFPSIRSKARPMSENTLTGALRRLGYSGDEMTAHGFRSMASTLLNEQGWNRDAIERQLAHAERDGVRAAYNRAEYLTERRQMMQQWADYLDSLRAGAEIVILGRRA